MNSDKIEAKKQIRKEIRTFFASDAGKKIVESEKQKQNSDDYCKRFLDRIPFYKNAKTVFAYCPLKPEFPTMGLLKQSAKDGKEIAVPLVVGENLLFKKVEFINAELSPVQKGSFDVMEPMDSAETLFPNGCLNLPLLILVPGRAFSAEGARLGWGGGFYDRFFEKLFSDIEKSSVSLVGLAFDEQMRNDIPLDKFDYKLDLVLNGLDC